jgi:hypothetical protein
MRTIVMEVREFSGDQEAMGFVSEEGKEAVLGRIWWIWVQAEVTILNVVAVPVTQQRMVGKTLAGQSRALDGEAIPGSWEADSSCRSSMKKKDVNHFAQGWQRLT